MDEVSLKTSKIAAVELLPLQRTSDIFEKCHPPPSFSTSFHNSTNDSEGEASYLPMSPSTSGLPPQPPQCKSLERNINQNTVASFGRISSLERRQQQMADYSMKGGNRSQSLIRQFSAGIHQTDVLNRSASLERNQQQQLPPNYKATHSFSNNFEKFQNPLPPSYVRPVKGGSLERSQAIIMNDLMRKYYHQKAVSDASKPRSGGSLERNVQYQQYLIQQKQQLQQQLQAQQQAQQHHQPQQLKEELIEENIYDFGGVLAGKSCASISLKRGMLPSNNAISCQTSCLPGFDSITSSGPSSLITENRPTIQPPSIKPAIAFKDRLKIFQGNQTKPNTQSITNPHKTFSNPNYFTLPTQMETKEPQQVRNFLFLNFQLNVIIWIFIFFSLCVYFW